MKISRRVTYGIQFMLYLGIQKDKEFIKLNEISSKENISEKFLENIASSLKKSDLLEVKRGAYGGYKPSKPISEITIKDIYQALEGKVLQYESGDSKSIKTSESVIIDSFKKIEDSIAQTLESITLDELAKELKKNNNNFMFYI